MSKQPPIKAPSMICNTDSGLDNTVSSLMNIRKMIADNYSILFVYLLLLSIIVFVLYYFGKQLIVLIHQYYANKATQIKTTLPMSNNTEDAAADSNNYDSDAELPPDNMNDYMEPGKKNFVKSLDKVYQDYNAKMDDFMHSIGKPDNDNKVDSGVFFKAHDDYKYVDKQT